eukprot:scaffold241_cov229-Prasinococcus_capsulatus_cf.AAC.7
MRPARPAARTAPASPLSTSNATALREAGCDERRQLAQARLLLLGVVDAVAAVDVAALEDIEHRQDLSVVRYQRLAHRLGAAHAPRRQVQDRVTRPHPTEAPPHTMPGGTCARASGGGG